MTAPRPLLLQNAAAHFDVWPCSSSSHAVPPRRRVTGELFRRHAPGAPPSGDPLYPRGHRRLTDSGDPGRAAAATTSPENRRLLPTARSQRARRPPFFSSVRMGRDVHTMTHRPPPRSARIVRCAGLKSPRRRATAVSASTAPHTGRMIALSQRVVVQIVPARARGRYGNGIARYSPGALRRRGRRPRKIASWRRGKTLDT
jgi:hypothetical protein